MLADGAGQSPRSSSVLTSPSPSLPAIAEVLKCEHERAVHLFVDSLVNQDKPSFAFQCTDSNRFKKGICLSCRKNRCNSIGYNAKKTRNKRNSKMYLKTRAGMPFRGNLHPCPPCPAKGPFPYFRIPCSITSTFLQFDLIVANQIIMCMPQES